MPNYIQPIAWILVLEFFCNYKVELRPAYTRRNSDNVDGFEYLANFGYLGKANLETGALRSKEELETAIRQFQKMANIRQTGTLDAETLQKMKSPRCGIPDLNTPSGGPQKFALAPSKWDKKDLTYRIQRYTNDLYWGYARDAFAKALGVWSDVAPLSFREVSSDADIEIFFASSYHNDGYAFDGPGNVLAHAFPPGEGRGGDAHFDDDEKWTLETSEGTNLFAVAAHEFGHSLGIYHSNVEGALMYPWYQGYDPNLRLHDDDIRAIQTLYGRSSGPQTRQPDPRTRPTQKPITSPNIVTQPPARPTRPSDPEKPNPCDTDVDAVTTVRGEVFAFKGKWFWRMYNGVVPDEYPVEIKYFWSGLPSEIDSIDAVYERSDGKIIFFRGKKYWELDGLSLASGFPKSGRTLTSLGLPESVTHIDAAFLWGLNKRTYLFSGYNYWRMDASGLQVDKGYPKATDMWDGIPVPFDAVFTYKDGKTYFFKDKKYWSFDDRRMKVEPGYPKAVSHLWTPCVFNIQSSASGQITGSLFTIFGLTLYTLYSIALLQ